MGAAASCGGKGIEVKDQIPTFKIVLVGDPEVGKTSIFLRFTKNQFDYSYQPSMSVSIGNIVRKVNIPYEVIVSVILWDLPGREEMDLRRSYYKDVDAAIVVVDMDDLDSITLAGTWKQDIINNAVFTGKSENPNTMNSDGKKDVAKSIPILLVGNKADKLKLLTGDEDSVSGYDGPTEMMKILEQAAIQHGFVGSVTVSAKESDGSVHAAIQSLIRHMLQKRHQQKKGGLFSGDKTIEEKKFVTISPYDEEKPEFIPLLNTKISEFDVFFADCNQPIETIENTSTALIESMANFKRACSVAGVTSTGKASLEECIGGLKELIRTDDDEEGLEAHDDGGYIKLLIKEDEVKDVPGPVSRVLKTFHNELCQSSKKVLSNCPVAHNRLKETQQKIDKLRVSAFDRAMASGMSQRRARAALANIDANCNRIREAIATAMESMTAVENDYKKIKAAMLW
ncbi:uncharacterized protein LOC5516669 [Nematostella vectensis]|uniref:uncharacterized protein LOC5516669 n=1 Tax=Nematostella vectensis TaxID=45351 RepID=UPI0020772246|nr:uncharacterized protein LOC5516669 [Nematostella vectensis]